MENGIEARSMCDGGVFGDGQKKEARRVAIWSDLPGCVMRCAMGGFFGRGQQDEQWTADGLVSGLWALGSYKPWGVSGGRWVRVQVAAGGWPGLD